MSRIALVLGAGGATGHAFHCGVVWALQEAYGWDAREADVIVGTSAGAQVAALLRAGMSPVDLAARVTETPMSPEGAAIAKCLVRPSPPGDGVFGKPAALPYLWTALKRPWKVRPGRLAAAMLREGQTDLGPMVEGFRGHFGHQWPERELWIPVLELETGRRTALGREDAPKTDPGTAVAASSAVPGIFSPMRIGEHRYVDGGIASANHADLVADGEYDLVVVSSPLSRFGPLAWLLSQELRKVEKSIPVLRFEPDPAIVKMIGWSPMDPTHAPDIVKAAFLHASRLLESDPVRDQLVSLW